MGYLKQDSCCLRFWSRKRVSSFTTASFSRARFSTPGRHSPLLQARFQELPWQIVEVVKGKTSASRCFTSSRILLIFWALLYTEKCSTIQDRQNPSFLSGSVWLYQTQPRANLRKFFSKVDYKLMTMDSRSIILNTWGKFSYNNPFSTWKSSVDWHSADELVSEKEHFLLPSPSPPPLHMLEDDL